MKTLRSGRIRAISRWIRTGCCLPCRRRNSNHPASNLERSSAPWPDVLRPNGQSFVYFPEEGTVSLVLQLEDESVIDVGLVGKEGMVGALAPLGATAISGEARVQMAGSALRMRAGMLRTEAARSPDSWTYCCDTCRRYLHKYPSQFHATVGID
jgi:hypothetical protein